MNIPVLIAGIIGAMATIGHFTVGRKLYLRPLLNSDMELLPKKVMQTVFHYISVYMVLSSWILIMIGIQGEKCMFDPTLVLSFIAYNYLFFGIVQIVTALRSKIPGALLKMFQWIFWLLIAALTLYGAFV
ncbi:hypothetical protein [Carboxylicivirga sp. N1Y90]|uniref:hypothetical protein n=1 Tax=Carboxylicivirga fragile TaxID=3417571 RepID=UPI003D33A5D7|nr:hypothetical protein [Marinilabiliaceae bacterium N1Y90]